MSVGDEEDEPQVRDVMTEMRLDGKSAVVDHTLDLPQ